MSSCTRCRQAHSTAKTNWNGDTVRSLLQRWSIVGGTLRLRPSDLLDGLDNFTTRFTWAFSRRMPTKSAEGSQLALGNGGS